jgi:hypothetical protein
MQPINVVIHNGVNVIESWSKRCKKVGLLRGARMPEPDLIASEKELAELLAMCEHGHATGRDSVRIGEALTRALLTIRAMDEAWQTLLAMLEDEVGHDFDARRELVRLGLEPGTVGEGPPFWEAYFEKERARKALGEP